MPKIGGAAQSLGSESDGVLTGNVEENAAVSSGYAFWVGNKGVYRVPLLGGPSQLWVKTGCAHRLLADADTVYFSCYQGFIGFRKATDPPDLNFEHGSTPGSRDFAVDATYLYYFESGGIFRKAKSGGTAELVVGGAQNGSLLPALTVDDHNLYWGQPAVDSRPVYYSTKQLGATGVPLWDAIAQVERIASNDSWVYWVDNAWRLYRTARP